MPGVPIRLIRRDKKIISLECTDYMLQLQRGIMTQTIPLSAERYAGDLNMVTTSIRLNVILSDDDCGDVETDSTQATAGLDLSRTDTLLFDAGTAQVERFFKTDSPSAGGQITRALLHDAIVTIPARASNGTQTTLTILLKDATGTHDIVGPDMVLYMQSSNGSNPSVSALGTEPTGHQVAVWLHAFITNNSTFTGLITATLQAVAGRDTGSDTSFIKITNVNKGEWSEQVSFTTTGTTQECQVTNYSGGAVQPCYSAGDKVQNLVGVVVNNTVLGGMGAIAQGVPGVGSDGINLTKDFLQGNSADYVNDYIVGIQIPYNSFKGVTPGQIDNLSSPPQGYNTKNFYYATGFHAQGKGADANIRDASDPFELNNNYTGIRGTVSAFEFKYNAGATIYEGSITFSPLDFIVGI